MTITIQPRAHQTMLYCIINKTKCFSVCVDRAVFFYCQFLLRVLLNLFSSRANFLLRKFSNAPAAIFYSLQKNIAFFSLHFFHVIFTEIPRVISAIQQQNTAPEPQPYDPDTPYRSDRGRGK